MLNAREKVARNTKLSPPGPRGGFLPERLLWAYRRDPLQFLSGLARDYGDIVLVTLGRQKVYLLNHPDFIRDVLVTKEADFTSSLAHLQSDPINSNNRSSQWRVADLRLAELFRPLSVAYSQVGFKELVIGQAAHFTLGWQVGQVIDLQSQIEQLTSQIAHQLLAEWEVPADLQQQAKLLVKSGQVALAQSLVSTLLLLSRQPEFDQRVHYEARTVLAGLDPYLMDIQRLVYTRMLLTETLRLYPPIWAIQRQALRDSAIGGYTISAGEVVWISPWVVQHDPRFYPEPWRFDPGRWSAEQMAQRNRFSYLPFGTGPRRCLGEGFAWMQGIMILAMLLLDWKFELLPGQPTLPAQYPHKPKIVPPIVLKGR